MHMSDALLAPGPGLALWAASAGALAVACRRVAAADDDRLPPLMGLLGAFVFAAQMINFSIPGTGSSGHLGGGLLLAALLGPWPALVVISSLLAVQALLFADGGLLALGANIFNLGVLPCLVAYPLVFRPVAGPALARTSGPRLVTAAVLAALVALLLGACGVVLQTTWSGISSLPATTFAALMLPIHAAIGLVEGAATAALLLFVQRQRPEWLAGPAAAPRAAGRAPGWRRGLRGLGLAAAILASTGAWFASQHPDGLEWSIEHASTSAPPPASTSAPGGFNRLHERLAAWQARTAAWTDYTWPGLAPAEPAAASDGSATAAPADWPAVDAGTSLAGLLGGAATLVLVVAVAAGLRLRRRGRAPGTSR